MAVQNFSTFHTRYYFRKNKVVEHKVCFDFLYSSYLKHFSF